MLMSFNRYSVFMLSVLVTATVVASDLETVLVKNKQVTLTKGDYQADLLRIPPEMRGGFSMKADRIQQVLNQLLVAKMLAAEARELKLDKDPLIQKHIALEVDKVLARFRMQQLEAQAREEFDKKRDQYVARARELYITDKEKYKEGERVNASHILIRTQGRGQEEALKLAKNIHSQIQMGAQFETLVSKYSEDNGSKNRGGELGFFTFETMVEPFAKAAFAMQKEGDISEPILSDFGYHIIRFLGRKPAGYKAFEDVRESIYSELIAKHLDDKRNQYLQKIHNDPDLKIDQAAVDSLQIKIDPSKYDPSKYVAPSKEQKEK